MSTTFDTAVGGGAGLSDDEALELQIETAFRCAMHCEDRELMRDAFHAMSQLIAQRSPEQIERMERARGLRA
jgi:hypothetical protein